MFNKYVQEIVTGPARSLPRTADITQVLCKTFFLNTRADSLDKFILYCEAIDKYEPIIQSALKITKRLLKFHLHIGHR